MNRSFIKNTGWILADRLLHMILSVLVTGLMARYLGTEKYGVLNYGVSYISIFTIVCKLGIDSILVNEIIQRREKAGELVGTTIFLRFLSGLLSSILIVIIVSFVNHGNTEILIITAIQSISLLFVSFDTIDFWFQSGMQSKYTAMSKFLAYLFVCAWRLMLIWMKASVVWFAWATVIEALAIGFFLYVFLFKTSHMKLKVSMAAAKQLLSKSHYFIISSLLVTIYTQMDRIMVGVLNTESEVGIYSAALTITNMWILVPVALIDSARPLVMDFKSRGEESSYMQRYTKLYSIIIWLGIIAGIGAAIFSPLAIYIIYGKEYAAAAPVLTLLIISKLFSSMGIARGIWLVCEEKAKYQKYFVGSGAVTNLILNTILIPHWGALGAAIATLITEIVVAVISPCFFKETRPMLKIMKNGLMLSTYRKKNLD